MKLGDYEVKDWGVFKCVKNETGLCDCDVCEFPRDMLKCPKGCSKGNCYIKQKQEKETMYSEEMKQRAKDAIEILTAVIEGKEVEYKDGDNTYILRERANSILGGVLHFFKKSDYAVKETPEYVPFEKIEEIWKYVGGTIFKCKNVEEYDIIRRVFISPAKTKDVIIEMSDGGQHCFKSAFNCLVFADTGLPFGKLKENK